MSWIRWRQQSTSEASASIVIDGVTKQDVWAFMAPAENAPLMDPRAIRGFTEPGTGPGIGERQTIVLRCDPPCGKHEVPTTIEIVEMDADHVVFMTLSAPAVRTHIRAESVGQSVRLTLTTSILARVDESVIRELAGSMLSRVAQHFAAASGPGDNHG